METLISVRNLVNQFGTQRVHDGLNLDIGCNEVLCLVGSSGSGKSVLLRTIIGLNQPASGTILFHDEDITRMDADTFNAMRHDWGVMFQRGALFSSLTVADNIMFPMNEFSSLTEAEQLELMFIRLKMVGLDPDVAWKYPASLSGGMVKRVALARALALDPVVLFLDEPTSGLDPSSAEAFDELIVSLHRNLDITVVMVTHDPGSLASVCDRIALLVNKKVITGYLQELLTHPNEDVQRYFSGKRTSKLLSA